MRLVHTDVQIPSKSIDLIRTFLDSGDDMMEIQTDEPPRTVYYRLMKYVREHPDLGVEVKSVHKRLIIRRRTDSGTLPGDA